MRTIYLDMPYVVTEYLFDEYRVEGLVYNITALPSLWKMSVVEGLFEDVAVRDTEGISETLGLLKHIWEIETHAGNWCCLSLRLTYNTIVNLAITMKLLSTSPETKAYFDNLIVDLFHYYSIGGVYGAGLEADVKRRNAKLTPSGLPSDLGKQRNVYGEKTLKELVCEFNSENKLERKDTLSILITMEIIRLTRTMLELKGTVPLVSDTYTSPETVSNLYGFEVLNG